jgi:hypothetical protein
MNSILRHSYASRSKINFFLHDGKLAKENEEVFKKCGVASDRIKFVVNYLLQ